jgi:hypothetical protein
MDHHNEAWLHVKQHFLGTVCEVTRKRPWGFIHDMPEIVNMTVSEFLSSDDYYDTIILHILSGEGEYTGNIYKAIREALNRCIKLIILEHNPQCKSFENIRDIDWMFDEIYPNRYIIDNWGRNLLIACSTTTPLQLPQLSDRWLRDNISKSYVTKDDCGIDKDYLIYTHTSESPIDFVIPPGKVVWVAGGGLCLESMSRNNVNIIIDPILKQCIYIAFRVGVERWKLERLCPGITMIHSQDYLPQWDDPKHWRRTIWNYVVPDSIELDSLENAEGDTVYVSTVDMKYWKHLAGKCNIIDSFTERDKPKLIMK